MLQRHGMLKPLLQQQPQRGGGGGGSSSSSGSLRRARRGNRSQPLIRHARRESDDSECTTVAVTSVHCMAVAHVRLHARGCRQALRQNAARAVEWTHCAVEWTHCASWLSCIAKTLYVFKE
jgi:hypothetical protein